MFCLHFVANKTKGSCHRYSRKSILHCTVTVVQIRRCNSSILCILNIEEQRAATVKSPGGLSRPEPSTSGKQIANVFANVENACMHVMWEEPGEPQL